jgi:hypothetical protein
VSNAKVNFPSLCACEWGTPILSMCCLLIYM